MPPFGGILKTSDQLWKIITFIRSVNPSSVKQAAAAIALCRAAAAICINFW